MKQVHRNLKFILSVFVIFTLAACKKDHPFDDKPGYEPLIQDGPLSPHLGKLIYLSDYGLGSGTPFWGRNSDEIFITVSDKILKVDLANEKVAALETQGGAIIGKTNENSGLIILGRINTDICYYTVSLHNNNIEKIISVPLNQGSRINIAANNIFYYQSPISTPLPPCNGYCWGIPGPFVAATFYHLDKQTQEITPLRDKYFLLFSTDGSKSILGSRLQQRMYVFDNTSRTITDSALYNTFYSRVYGLFYYNGVLHSYETDVFGKITIKDFFTSQVLQQYETNKVGFEDIKVSRDGTKLYYTAGFINGGKLQIQLYDLGTNSEKLIAELAFLPGGARPFDYFILSDDNKKIAIKAGADLYVKAVN